MRLRRPILLAGSCAASVLLMEAGLRLFVAPSALSYGTFLGHELPPVVVVPDRPATPAGERDAWHDRLVVGGLKITTGDLWGYYREDPLLGYVNRENATSVNRWWQSNSLGARERSETPRAVPAGRLRLLVFGDSYAQGSRVPQEEAWSEVLEATAPALDVVNLAVDGYGMGQAYLRYRELRSAIEHDVVLLVIVPIRDLWRDINVLRTLGEDWDLHIIMPRFVLEQDELRLARSPYADPLDVFRRNRGELSPELAEHLRRYDRFWFEGEHREAGLLGRSVLHKLGSAAYYEIKRRRLRDSRLEPAAEDLQVTGRIFEAMDQECRRAGASFVVVLLPSERDLARLRLGGAWQRNWSGMVEEWRRRGLRCIDLAEPFLSLPTEHLDAGYDGTHYGPRANARIADEVRKGLLDLGLLDSPVKG